MFYAQYRDCLREVNGGDENRVHLPNIELSYIRQLQHDNSELRSLLEEHQAALEIIMGKYRQQVLIYAVVATMTSINSVVENFLGVYIYFTLEGNFHE